MFGEDTMRRPPKKFSLLYLENNEMHLVSNKVSLVTDPSLQEVEGILHLCSRSIFFEPDNIAKPLLRFKFSCGVLLRMMKNVQTKKLQKLCTIRRSDAEFKELITKGPSFLNDLLEQEQIKKSKNKTTLFASKLFEPIKKKRFEAEQKVCCAFFIRVPKVFFIYRKPISPYITQKVEDSFVFMLDKAAPPARTFRFLKLYDELTKCIDEEKMLRSIIAASLQEAAQQLLQLYQNQKLQASNILKCRRVLIQGCEHGQFTLLKNRVKYIPILNAPGQTAEEFTYRQIKYIHRYRYLFQNIGIQIWLYNSPHSFLFVFNDYATRENIFRQLKDKAQKIINVELSDVTNQWINGQLSNVQYINKVNRFANRSLNDLSQYPIFPWVIHNYDGQFDLKNPQIFRDLSKPIGAINKHRLRKLKDLYQLQLKDKTANFPPHLYPTHYSTPGYVSYFLIRKIPQFIVRIQNGVFSPSERIFRCVQSAYFSSMNSVADYKQLIPQFYSAKCGFLVNSQKLEMGSTPEGQVIDDVVLPKWASGAQDFMIKMRSAFESDYVSAHINEWIDLIFGYKQSGTSAKTFDNLFYHLTYQENVNFDKPMSRVERAALEVQVSQFGQTPIQIFQDPHPVRKARILTLQLGAGNQENKIINAKIVAINEQNERLQEQLERQRYRYNKKLNEKQQMLMRNHKDKKRELERMRQMLQIDSESLRKFQFKKKFNKEQDKDVYIRQMEQLLMRRQRQNQEMNLIVTGLKRQILDDGDSVNSNIEENVKLQQDFLQDQ